MTTYLLFDRIYVVLEKEEIVMNSKEMTDELIRLFKRMQKINLFRNIASNLTQAETDVLMVLYFHQLDFKEPLTIKGISNFFNIKSSSTIQFVNSLEKYGYVERKSDKNDKRVTLVYITEFGMKIAKFVDTENRLIMKKIIEQEDIVEVKKAFDTINCVLDTIEEIPMKTIGIREELHS